MKFIKIFIFLLLSSNALAGNSDDFENKMFGFKMSKPSDWHFLTAKEHYEGLKRINLEDKKFQEILAKKSSAPMVVITKHQEPFDDLNPSFKVSVKPIGRLINSNALKTIEAMTPIFEKMFTNFKIQQKPTKIKIFGLEASYTRFNYSVSIPDGRTFPATSEIWIIPKENYFFMIGVGFRQDEKTGSYDEIKSILDTIVIQ